MGKGPGRQLPSSRRDSIDDGQDELGKVGDEVETNDEINDEINDEAEGEDNFVLGRAPSRRPLFPSAPALGPRWSSWRAGNHTVMSSDGVGRMRLGAGAGGGPSERRRRNRATRLADRSEREEDDGW